ncbi:MAG: nucleotidyltransferase family protein [Crenarchaeota archaeon]|jgi:predicted nucleotidyltransferase|nr:nucleotidyltransferase family protein [Thermoproteota archaeon]
MRPSELIQLKRHEIYSILDKYKTLDNLRVFGSVAKGTDNEDSDIDLLIDAHKGTTLLDLGGFQDELQTLLGVKVDLLTPKDISKHFVEVILKEAIPL